ncbi:hypothetical protein [Paraburkholderia aromaticivorans]|uniref:hypothetical protein n=1 Tax=Paraburkholderia aromaticivorans TaxID=2026199 RepID=UPI00145606DF|nr:hypothetical protein [Paraburkholderia aromaticivorans]
MATFLSAPAFHTQKALESLGLSATRNQIHEFFGSFLGYHHLGEMQADLDEIEFHLQQSTPLVVLQCHAGYLRIADLLKRYVRADQVMPVYEVVKHHLRSVLPATTFDDEYQLLSTWVAQEVRRCLLADDNQQVVDAQLRVASYCDIFVHDDIDFPTLIDVRDMMWQGDYMGILYRAKPDGTPAYAEDQIGTSAHLNFEKVGQLHAVAGVLDQQRCVGLQA